MRLTRGTGKAAHHRTFLASVLCVIAAWHAAAPAETAPVPRESPARPRIGLVLGGGGAKGAAHVGVIKVLEEMRIPIDCIAGTSMGSIVGAAYATGMSAQQLQQVITAVNWREILASAPRQEIPVNRKHLDFVYTLGLELGLKSGSLVTPAGLVPTHQIEALFQRITARAGQVSDFDQLPIPFRAVATDLESGKMKVFDHGDIAAAMRASMAVPGAFAPLEYEGHLYVDGMLVRNLPVDVARQTCADVVIAVPVGNPAQSRANLSTAAGIIGQAMSIAIDANEKAQLATLKDGDVAIPVILQDITSSDFAKVPEAIPTGEAAARKASAALSRYSVSPEAYAEWRAGLTKLAAIPKVRIDEVRLIGFRVTNPDVMRTFLQTKVGDIYDPAKAEADTTRLVARGDFSSVNYQLSSENGRNVLTYTAVEKPWSPNYVRFNMNLSTDFTGDTAWGLRGDYDKRWIDALGGEFRTSAQVGHPNFFAAEFYQPLNRRQMFFIAPSVLAYQVPTYLYVGDRHVAQLDTHRYEARLDGGVAMGSWGEFRLGVLRGGVDTGTDVGNIQLPDLGWNTLSAGTTRLVIDTLDKRLFPTKGTYALMYGNFSSTGLGADRTYRTAGFGVSHVLNASNRNTWTVALRGGSDFGSHAPFYDQFKLGGLFDFSGYRFNELIGRKYAFGGVQLRSRIGYLSETLGTAAYGGATLEAGNVFDRLDGTSVHGALAGGSLFVGIDSTLGPVYIAYGQSEGGHKALYLFIGTSIEAIGP